MIDWLLRMSFLLKGRMGAAFNSKHTNPDKAATAKSKTFEGRMRAGENQAGHKRMQAHWPQDKSLLGEGFS